MTHREWTMALEYLKDARSALREALAFGTDVEIDVEEALYAVKRAIGKLESYVWDDDSPFRGVAYG